MNRCEVVGLSISRCTLVQCREPGFTSHLVGRSLANFNVLAFLMRCSHRECHSPMSSRHRSVCVDWHIELGPFHAISRIFNSFSHYAAHGRLVFLIFHKSKYYLDVRRSYCPPCTCFGSLLLLDVSTRSPLLSINSSQGYFQVLMEVSVTLIDMARSQECRPYSACKTGFLQPPVLDSGSITLVIFALNDNISSRPIFKGG
jgi:hypothetical protein